LLSNIGHDDHDPDPCFVARERGDNALELGERLLTVSNPFEQMLGPDDIELASSKGRPSTSPTSNWMLPIPSSAASAG